MENQGKLTTVENLTTEIAEFLKKEIIAISEQKENSIEIRFLDGKKFRILVAEIL